MSDEVKWCECGDAKQVELRCFGCDAAEFSTNMSDAAEDERNRIADALERYCGDLPWGDAHREFLAFAERLRKGEV